MLDKPYDIAVMFGIFALIIVTVSFAVSDINTLVAVDHNDTFFSSAYSRVNSSTGFKGLSDEAAEGLSGTEGGGDDVTQESFILKGINSLLTLGQSWAIMEESLDDASDQLTIDPIYITVLIGLLVIAFAVTLYTWIRGS